MVLSEKARYRLGWMLAEPFWRLARLGDRAQTVQDRLIHWAECAQPGCVRRNARCVTMTDEVQKRTMPARRLT